MKCSDKFPLIYKYLYFTISKLAYVPTIGKTYFFCIPKYLLTNSFNFKWNFIEAFALEQKNFRIEYNKYSYRHLCITSPFYQNFSRFFCHLNLYVEGTLVSIVCTYISLSFSNGKMFKISQYLIYLG